MKKRILAFLLALTMVLSMVPVAFAADEVVEETTAAETVVTETATEPAVETAEPAEETAEPAQTEPTAPAVLPVEDALNDAEIDVHCICGGTHNGVNGHVCEDVAWVELNQANAAQYFAGTANDKRHTESNNLYLTEPVTIGAIYCIGNNTVTGVELNLDLAGKTITVTSSANRVFNLYKGCTLNICDSVGGGQIVVDTTLTAPSDKAPCTAGFVCFYGSPTATAPSALNIWGGTITRTSTAAFKACVIGGNTAYSTVNMYGGKITGFNNTYVDGTTTYPGEYGIICVNHNTFALNMFGGTISDCSSAKGAVYLGKGNVNISGGTISNCASTANGGAIYQAAGTVNISGGIISNCASTANGGAIYQAAGTLSVSGANFSNNKSSSDGGALYMAKGNADITDGTFSGNSAFRNGSAIYQVEGTLTVSNAGFIGNSCSGAVTSSKAPNSYGAVYIATGTHSFTNCQFLNNTASANGGVMRVNGGEVTLDGCTVTGNSCTYSDGGAFYLANAAVLNLNDTVVTDNHSAGTSTGYQASAIGMRGTSTLNVSGSTEIHDNTCTAASNKHEYDIGFAGNGLRTINIGELTGDGYVVVHNPNPAKVTVNEDDKGATIVHEKDGNKAYFAPMADVDDFDLSVDFAKDTYTMEEDVAFTVSACVSDDATVDSAYVKAMYAKVSAAPENINFNDIKVNAGYIGEEGEEGEKGKIALYMWADDDLKRPMKLTKTPSEIAVVHGAPAAEGACTVTVDVELATSAQAQPKPLKETKNITIANAVAHDHCFCGEASCTEHTETPAWEALTQANVDDLFTNRVAVEGDVWYYLTGDITVGLPLCIGDTTNASEVHLCLNGHKITTTAEAFTRIVNGKLTICDCDCEGKGTVEIDSFVKGKQTANGRQAGALLFWVNPAVAGATAEVYGGTYTYTDRCPAPSHGLIYVGYHGNLRIYDGVFDGKNKKTTHATDSSGLIACASNTDELTILGGTFKNGSTAGKGGAFFARSNCALTVKNATFENCHSDQFGGAIADSGLNATYENLTFIDNTATSGGDNIVFVGGGKKTVGENVDFGYPAVGGTTVVTLPGTAKISKYSELKGTITFNDVTAGTTLSVDGASFTDSDAACIKFGGESTATAVICDNGALKAIAPESTEISFVKESYIFEFNGSAVGFKEADVETDSDGAVTFKFYSDLECETEIAAPSEVGTYYAVATVAATENYHAATSDPVPVEIVLTPHTCCYCGGKFVGAVDHECATGINWQPLYQGNIADFSKTITEEVYFYLVDDVTVSTNCSIGTNAEPGNVHLDLNGHTLTSTSTRVINVFNGYVSVCDSSEEETGKIIINAASVSAGSFVFWQQPIYEGKPMGAGDAVFEMFGGYVQNAETTKPSSHGLIYCATTGSVHIYGGTLDGNNIKSTTGAGLIHMYYGADAAVRAKELKIYGGTFKNGSSAASGGAVIAAATDCNYIANATFENNAAVKNAGAISITGSATIENCTFIGNTAGAHGPSLSVGNSGGRFGELTISNCTDYGAIVVGDYVHVTGLGSGDTIDRYAALKEGSYITFSGISEGDVLSAEGVTSFNTSDAKMIKLEDSEAKAVICDEGALKAVVQMTCDITFKQELPKQEYPFTGSRLALDAATMVETESDGVKSLTYYTNEECTTALAKAPYAVGTYYVKATVASTEIYEEATTADYITVTITALEAHSQHCVCGSEFDGTGDHTCEDVNSWIPVGKDNVSEYIGNTGLTGDVYLYLVSDVTISVPFTAGTAKDAKTNPGVAGNVHIDLNGHNINATGYSAFRLQTGSLSVCDCQGDGKIIISGTSSSAARGAFFPNYSTSAGATFNGFGGTFTYADDCNPAPHGFIFCNYGGIVNIYGSNFDAKEKVANIGGGLITAESGVAALNVYGGTFKNGATSKAGGAIYSRAAVTTISGATFDNNVAPKGANIFIGGTATVDAAIAEETAIAVGYAAKLTLPGTAKIEKLELADAALNENAEITFTDVEADTVLSAEGVHTFTDADAEKITLTASDETFAYAVKCVGGTLVAYGPIVIADRETKAFEDEAVVKIASIGENATITAGANNTLTVSGDIGEGAVITLNEGSTMTLTDSFFSGKIVLNGGKLTLGAGVTIVDGMVVSGDIDSGKTDCGTIVFDNVDEISEKSVITTIATNNMNLGNSEKALPLKSADATYTVCSLNSKGGIWCPSVKPNGDYYKFRMMPRFASQTAYDILEAADSEDVFMIGFEISATKDDVPCEIKNQAAGTTGTSLNCDFALKDVKDFFAQAMDSYVFVVNVGGLEVGHAVTVVPYLKIKGVVVYTADDTPGSTEYATVTITD